MAWKQVRRPTKLGGLGVLDIYKFSRALRLRWLWQSWKSGNKPWVGMEIPCTNTDRRLFDAATKITIGNGAKALFWHSAWLDGCCPKDMAPTIFALSRKKNRTVQQAVAANVWVQDLNVLQINSALQISQFVTLWEKVRSTHLDPNLQDQITWRFCASGEYSARSAYLTQFLGSIPTDHDKLIWCTWAPPKCKFFAWLAFQNRLWTSDRLQKRGCPNQQVCPLCHSADESANHLLAHCRYSLRIWNAIRTWTGGNLPSTSLWGNLRSTHHWWRVIGNTPSLPAKAVRTLTILVAWEIWKERNARIFDRRLSTAEALITKIKDEARLWCAAGAKKLCEIIPTTLA